MKLQKFTYATVLLLLIFCIGTTVHAQTYYRSVTSGAWSSLATWEFSTDLTNWGAATATPGKAADSIMIQNGHSVTLNLTIALDQVQLLGSLTLQNGALVTYGDDPGTDYLTGPGEIIVESGGSISMESGTTVLTNLNMTIEQGGSVFYSGTNTLSITTAGNARTIDISGEFTINSRVFFEGSMTLNILTTGVFKIAEFNVPVTEINFSDDLGAGTTTNFFNLGLVEIGNPGVTGVTGSHIVGGSYSNTFNNLPGGRLHIKSNTRFAPVLSFRNTGIVEIDNATTLTFPGQFINNSGGGTVIGNGTLRVEGDFTNSGIFSPGLSPGALSVSLGGALTFNGGTLLIEMQDDGLAAGTGWDLLQVTGPANISGTTLTATATGPDFSRGRYVILTATSPITGQFTGASTIPFGFIIDYSEVTTPVAPNTSPNVALIKQLLLPLTWISFTGKYGDDKVQLDWVTGSESNTSHFSIERSADGRNFTAIGQVTAAGNTISNSSYQFTDRSPGEQDINYYRLKQVDIDGRFTYSAVIRISINKRNTFSATITPNPATSVLNLLIEGMQDKENIVFEITNSNGAIIHRERMVFTGTSMIKTIQRPSIRGGIYFYKVTRLGNRETVSGKLILQ